MSGLVDMLIPVMREVKSQLPQQFCHRLIQRSLRSSFLLIRPKGG